MKELSHGASYTGCSALIKFRSANSATEQQCGPLSPLLTIMLSLKPSWKPVIVSVKRGPSLFSYLIDQQENSVTVMCSLH